MKYDITEKKWITVSMKNKSKKGHRVMSLTELFKEAHNIKRVHHKFPSFEFGLYRFLFTVAMAAYRPETSEDIAQILEDGHFDDTITDYIRKCRKNGVTFDIFDETAPFMQAHFKEEEKAERLRSVAYLFPQKPSGKQSTFFDFNHTKETDSCATIEDCVHAMLAIPNFSQAYGSTLPSSVNGAPPMYYVLTGDSLFETIVLNMVSKEGYPEYGTPCWETGGDVIAGKLVGTTTLLRAMQFPTRKILLKEGENEITQIYFQQGENFQGYGAWEDPNVAYAVNKSGQKFSVKANLEDDFLLKAHEFIMPAEGVDGAPYIVKQLRDIEESLGSHAATGVVAYQMVGNGSKAGFLADRKTEFSIDKKILNTPKKRELFRACMADASHISDVLGVAMNLVSKKRTDKNGSKVPGVTKMAQRQALYNALEENMDILISKIAGCNMKSAKETSQIRGWWKELCRGVAKASVRTAFDASPKTLEELAGAYYAEAQLERKVGWVSITQG